MPNIIDYVQTEMASFSDKPFCDVDSLVLSQFSYIHFDRFVPSKKSVKHAVRLGTLFRAEWFADLLRGVRDPDQNRALLVALAASPRFRNIRLHFHINERDHALEKQFSATTFLLDSESAYVAFRGTDATLVGWKEDFNMAFTTPVPSQIDAVDYIHQAAKLWPGTLMLGGHSKGGNLAVYASASCRPAVQKRIKRVYSHDGPGFRKNTLDGDAFQRISNRIEKTLPQSSIIGMLLENQEKYTIVKSDRMGMMQHDPFSWIIEDNHFVLVEQLSRSAKYMDRALNEWLSSASDQQRETFVNTLYDMVTTGESENFAQMRAGWQSNLPLAVEKSKTLDDETKSIVRKLLKSMASSAFKSLYKGKKAAQDIPAE